MVSDITSKEDIHDIITKFYELLLHDPLMNPFFQPILEENQLAFHIKIIVNFWSDILFDTPIYKNNVMQKHLQQNALLPFEKVHFECWTSYFTATIDATFDGPQATKMKQRALSIASVMQLKMHHSS